MARLSSPSNRRNIWILVSLAALYPSTGYAYLDAGTGSYGFQMLLAVGLAAAFIIKMNWKKLKSKLSSATEKEDDRGNA